MFTGIIEELGRVGALERHPAGARLEIECREVLSDLIPGASVAVNGVCLTAVQIALGGFSADLAPETLHRSNLGSLASGSLVNLERPVTMQARLSGHIVQGHVDGTGTLVEIDDLGNGNRQISVQVPGQLDRYLVYKGSVTIDGISLTIASIAEQVLKVAIIPHTWRATNLHTRTPGDRVNIECDVLAKHVEKLLGYAALSDYAARPGYAAMDATSASTSVPMFSGVKSEG